MKNVKKPIVYFYNDLKNIDDSIKDIFKNIKKQFSGEKVGLKIHFGERNNTTYINPKYFDSVYDYFKEPYYIECNVLYKGERTTAKNHIKIAKEHGFTNIPIKILDGEFGREFTEILINQKNIKIAKVGKGISEFNELISIAHFKGHMLTGFGGAIKNIGMGLGSRTGKLEMHSSSTPVIYKNRCTACGNCANNCDVKAISLIDKAVIDKNKCIGCSMCIAVCPYGAIGINWSSDASVKVKERIAEYALASTINKKWFYVNFLINMTEECDCMGVPQKPIISDIGILFSGDPVAIDQASIDLVKKLNKHDPFKKRNNIDSQELLDYAESIGLGKKEYELVIKAVSQ